MKRLPCSPALPVATPIGALIATSAFGYLSGEVPASGAIAGSFGFGKLPHAAVGVDITYAGSFLSGVRFVAVTNADPAEIR